MSDLFAALNTASGALQAFQSALDVTQNNVSNSQTPGFVKQVPIFDALQFQLNQGLNGGVQAGTPQDTRNEYAESAVRQQVSLLGASSQLATSLDPIEQVFSVTGTGGISNALDTLVQSFSAWSANPGDVNARSTVVDAASSVAAAFQSAASQLEKLRSSTASGLQTAVDSINSIAVDIQKYNQARQSSAAPDAGLEAQKNAALEKLAQYADVQTLSNPDGTITVLLGGQVPLVTEDQVHKLSLTQSAPANAANPGAPPNISLIDDTGTDVTQKITEGQLGALLSVRNQILPRLIGGPSNAGDLNVLAGQVADNVNNVLTTAGGTALFSYDKTSPVVAASTLAVASGVTPSGLSAADPGPPVVSNGVALKLSALGSATQFGLQGMTFDQFYGTTASWIGGQLSQAQASTTAQTQTVSQAQALRTQLSGVSLDEEATRLMELQRSYQAASRMVSVLDTLSQSIIDMIH